DALASQEIQLTEEPAGVVAGDELFPSLFVFDDLDGAPQGDIEIVAGVPLAVEVFPGCHRSATAELLQRCDFGVVQALKSIWIGRQGEALAFSLSVQQRNLRCRNPLERESVRQAFLKPATKAGRKRHPRVSQGE